MDDFKTMTIESYEDLSQKNENPNITYWPLEQRLKIETNQGHGYSKNPARIESDNFWHRHESEAFITRAFKNNLPPNKKDSILFRVYPLAVALKDSNSRREEVDFMVLTKSGNTGILEVLGNSHNEELADERDSRFQPFRDAGVFIKGYKVPELFDINWANGVVDDFLGFLKNHYAKKTSMPVFKINICHDE